MQSLAARIDGHSTRRSVGQCSSFTGIFCGGALQSWWRLHRVTQTTMIQQMSICVLVIVLCLLDYWVMQHTVVIWYTFRHWLIMTETYYNAACCVWWFECLTMLDCIRLLAISLFMYWPCATCKLVLPSTGNMMCGAMWQWWCDEGMYDLNLWFGKLCSLSFT